MVLLGVGRRLWCGYSCLDGTRISFREWKERRRGGGLKPVEKGRSELRQMWLDNSLAAAALGWAGLYVQKPVPWGLSTARTNYLVRAVATAVPGLAAVAGISCFVARKWLSRCGRPGPYWL